MWELDLFIDIIGESATAVWTFISVIYLVL